MYFHKYQNGCTVNLDQVVSASKNDNGTVSLYGANAHYITSIPEDEFISSIRKKENDEDNIMAQFTRNVRDFMSAVNRMPTSLKVHY